MTGKLDGLLGKDNLISSHIVTQLSKTLGLSLQDDVTAVMKAYDDSRGRPQGRGRNRQGSGRRDLLKEVGGKWPELADERKWAESALLKSENQQQLLSELKQLPSWKAFDERRQQMETADKAADQRELRNVKLRRLIHALEVAVLEKNLPVVAKPEIVERYRKLKSLEESHLNPGGISQ